ncbi:FRAS1-related extracellular matrix protein 2 [Nymphon striatum]|nr:FRAS1-related extracellular matrix protein 2 [Nymphon striatum]
MPSVITLYLLLHLALSQAQYNNNLTILALNPSPKNIVQSNNPISVPRGQREYLSQAKHLKVEVGFGDQCLVRVLQNDPLSQRPGKLYPEEFPCDYGDNEVYYTHFGSPTLKTDQVKLLIRYDTRDDTVILPVLFKVEVVDSKLRTVSKNVPLQVGKVLSESPPLDGNIVQLDYDKSSETCKIRLELRAVGLPRSGQIINMDPQGELDCDGFSNSDIKYKHMVGKNSPNIDYIPFLVELLDQNGDPIFEENFQVIVNIAEGKVNTPPKVAFSSELILNVNQFIMTAITSEALTAGDNETLPGDLIFNIITPIKPGEGRIVNTDDQSLPITSFYQRDVTNFKVAYVPPTTDSDAKRVINLSMEVLDTEGAKSPKFTFSIIVNPKNSNSPIATKNTGIQLFEGQSRPLKSSENLKISDEDNLNEVSLTVVSGLVHGELLLNNTPVKRFTAADLDTGVVRYQHDGSDTYSDNIVFDVSDKKHNVELLFPIAIFPEDDQPPILTTNTGIILNEGEEQLISNSVLSATDVDSDIENITYIINPNQTFFGEFVFRQVDIPSDPQNWNFSNGVYEQAVSSWIQADIDNENIYYKYKGGHLLKEQLDKIKFLLTDNNDPPNPSLDYEQIVRALPVDNTEPEPWPNVPLKITVREFETKPLTKKEIRYTDKETDDSKLKYKITVKPTDTDIGNSLDPGKLIFTDNPNAEVIEFTQSQINHHKVAYKPPPIELGITLRVIQFQFQVEDENGNIKPSQRFLIFIQPIDNKPPYAINKGLTVFENGNVVITKSMLDVLDPDTDTNDIKFTLTEQPAYGHLQHTVLRLEIGDFFTRMDLENNLLAYVHNGAEEDSDQFKLDVSDGLHHVPVEIFVTVKAVDDEPPQVVPASGTLGYHIYVDEKGSTPLKPDVIKATDPDTDDSQIMFFVEGMPQLGTINVAGKPTDRFKQQDITDNKVEYVHSKVEIGPNPVYDVFNLTISDQTQLVAGANKLEHVVFNVTILPVDTIAPSVIVGEMLVVTEGEKSHITLKHVNATDEDTDVNKVTCMITVQPSYGYVENSAPFPGSQKPRTGFPASSFNFNDISRNNINYVQSVHQNVEPTEDRFIFECTDGVNMSPKFVLSIQIVPTNDEVPKMYFREFVVEEGEDLVIDLPLLNAEDLDVPQDKLFFIIAEKPQYGRIISRLSASSTDIEIFSIDEIKKNPSIVYEHDSSETTQDSFTLNITDGFHNISQRIPIKVLPVDDETPRLIINNGLNMKIGDTVLITNKILKADDLDSDNENLTYTVRKVPDFGSVVMLDATGSHVNLTTGMNFTQTDINFGRIAYQHTAYFGDRDVIKFDVSDGYNVLIDRYFYVSVAGYDDVYPDVVSKGVELPEAGKVTLTTDTLSTSDLNSRDEELQFIITKSPGKGHVENTDNPGTPITEFKQIDLAGNKIYYVHTSDNEVKKDRFDFEVTDGFNSVYRTFRVTITGVDNKKPVVFKADLPVNEGESAYVTPFELKIEDEDTDAASLKISITQVPVHGELRFDKRPASTFTMEDIDNNLITYQHDGSESLEDSFSFIVTDGTHQEFFVHPNMKEFTSKPQNLHIKIRPVDNGHPQLVVNKGSSAVTPLEEEDVARIKDKFGFRFTDKMIKAEDRDSDNKELKYVIKTRPKYGHIVNLKISNSSVDEFKQGDMDEMQIYYILNDNINSTLDTFFFDVVDTGNNVLKNKSFNINWSWISLPLNVFSVNETDEFLTVKLIRRGYLGETSFVGVKTVDKSAKINEDFHDSYAKQVQFNPGQSESEWRLRIIADDIYEAAENFEIVLEQSVLAVLESPTVALVSIIDDEDVSVVYIPKTQYDVFENNSNVIVPIKRSGDVSKEMRVICSTISGSAIGTIPSSVLSYSDFISRPESHKSIVKFNQGEDYQECKIVIIDDSLYENSENFTVKLSIPMGGIIGATNTTTINILSDINDVPVFRFDTSEYIVDESDGQIEAKVWRTGSDLSKSSSVTVQSRPSDSPSAQVGYDYVGIGKNLHFLPGVTLQTFKITILDDLGQPKLEGLETFEIVLRMPDNATIGTPNKVIVSINDTVSDLPTMMFEEQSYFVQENKGKVAANIIRRGDIGHKSTVRCFTRQNSAKVDEDFYERPDTDDSIITFEPGEIKKPCILKIKNDTIHELDEMLRLVLGSPQSQTAGLALTGSPNEANITINDDSDQPIITFEKKRYNVMEPKNPNDIKILKVKIIKQGDLSKTSVVRVHTKDGSAKSGSDYFGISKEVIFEPNTDVKTIEIEILHDGEKEHREALTLHLKSEKSDVKIENKKAIIYIQEMDIVADVTFPTPPMVVSLRDYDRIESASSSPIAGYPVACITPCDPKHPEYTKTGDLCTNEKINNSLTEFRWRVAAPTGNDGVTSELRDVEAKTFFTDPYRITLDSIYFAAGSRIQCAARAVNVDGDSGLEIFSPPVTIDKTDGICTPRILGSYGAEPFTAKMRYTGLSDPDYPNRMKLSIIIPHRDGMLPIISTDQLANFELTLSPDGLRIGNHRCSNLLDYNEISTQHGFITKETKDSNVIGEVEPYQFSKNLRTEKTLRFYKNLNLEDCTWKFETYYDMSELITHCGGKIGTDGQVLDLVQSYVSVNLPLYVSYIFHSPVASGGWQHNDLESDLRLTFVYDTAILWQQGISAPEESQLQGYLYPTSMKIPNDGRLVVNFRTKSRFKGQFVLNHPSLLSKSMVTSSDHPELTFTLRLVKGQPTYAQPEQEWEFVSDFASVCNPRDPIEFDMQVRFQQVSDPVPEKFSLNTQFHLMRKRSVWLSDETAALASNTDVSFTKGDTIYGRIMVDPVQSLGTSFFMNIEKCYLCTGVDGYIPKYDPENQEYGCVARSSNLLHIFKIIDKESPSTVSRAMRNVSFNAVLSSEDPNPDAQKLVSQPGSDGFRIDSTPLFEVAYGRQWFIHCIYTVRSKENAQRGIGKRSIDDENHVFHEYSAQSTSRVRRDLAATADMGSDGKGTNIHRISLDYGIFGLPSDNTFDIEKTVYTKTSIAPIWPLVVGILITFLVIIIIIIFILTKKRHNSQQSLRVPTPRTARRVAATIAVTHTCGNGKVVYARKYRPTGTEV